jgi:hypothetical protein
MLPGDKRLLYLTLPKHARFWFAFVNQNGVWPWREQDRILIPLEQRSRDGKATPVELFYSSQIGPAGQRTLDLELLAPKFDLPLENITWRVYLNEKWHLKHTDLRIGLVARPTKAASWNVRLLILAGTLIVLVSFAGMGRSFHRKESEASRPESICG